MSDSTTALSISSCSVVARFRLLLQRVRSSLEGLDRFLLLAINGSEETVAEFVGVEWLSSLRLSSETIRFSFFLEGLNRCASPVFSSPSRIGRRQKRISLSCPAPILVATISLPCHDESSKLRFRGDSSTDGDFLLWLEEDNVDCCFLVVLSMLLVLSSDSASISFVRTEDVTSHHTVLKSSRMRQRLHEGAIAVRRPVFRNKSELAKAMQIN